MNYKIVLDKKIQEIFTDKESQLKALRQLDKYGIEERERETFRVRLDILKCCNGNYGLIDKFLDAAKQDYRDVLAWAEYPHQMELAVSADDKQKKMAIKKDREQYNEWLKK